MAGARRWCKEDRNETDRVCRLRVRGLRQSVPEIPYESVANFLKLPADLHLGEVSGVAVNSRKHVFVFSRGTTVGPARART